MPIYAYRCDACGFTQDVLQKLSDRPLSECPSCHAHELRKQVTAAGFQLKGSGWYATDFRNSPAATKKPPDSAAAGSPKKDGEAAAPAAADANAASSSSPESAKNTSESAAPAPSSSCSPGCACH